MSEALTREEYNKELLVIGHPETDTDYYIEALTNLRNHDAVQRATIQQQEERIESLQSTNRIAALALAEKEAEIARLKDIVRREAWLEHAAENDVPGPYVPWEDHRRELTTLEAEIERMKQDVNDLNQVLRNHGLAQGEIDAEASIDWKARAKWAARRVGVAIITKDDHQQAQRILEEA